MIIETHRSYQCTHQLMIMVKLYWPVIMMIMANLIMEVMRQIQTKIPDLSKYNHPALIFVRDNLSGFVAMLCYFNQVRCSCVININTCLLKNPIVGGYMLGGDDSLEGSYLYFYNKDTRWIRSRKAAGSNVSNPVNSYMMKNV